MAPSQEAAPIELPAGEAAEDMATPIEIPAINVDVDAPAADAAPGDAPAPVPAPQAAPSE
jgi:hypothetical protein